MLPVGNLDEVQLQFHLIQLVYWPVASSVYYTTSCKQSLVLLRMGEIIARNMLS